MRTHLATTHDDYGRVPLCGAAMWDRYEGLTDSVDRVDCWECRAIAGLSEVDEVAP